MRSLPLFFLSCLTQVNALAYPQRRAQSQSLNSSIAWSTQCKSLASTSSMPLKCANFEVPLDYTESNSSETLALTLVKVDAVKQPVKGSVLFNPGGPGGSGVQFVISRAKELMTILGGQFDLIGFDPRGVNNTLPFSCYETAEERAAFSPPMTLSNASDVALGQNFASAEITAANCLKNTEDIGGLLGTAFVARDMAQIVDALGEDGLLRYWGFSYGTLLGATFAAMFPEKVDKIVIDGNVNVHEYYSGWETESLVDLDGTLAGFYSGCIAAPDNCALAASGNSAEELSTIVNDFLEDLKYNPIPIVIEDGGGTFVNYAIVKQVIFVAMYGPNRWPLLAQGLQALVTGNSTGFLEVAQQLAGGGEDGESLYGIRCGEQAMRTDDLDSLRPLLAEMAESSSWGGADLGPSNTLTCVRWEETAKEIYSGDWNVQTRNPILLVGNTYDPVTPLVSARNNSAAFPGSVVLHHNGYGHCSIAQPSLCSANAIRAYFNDGVLPAPDAVCEPDIPLFSNMTWKDAFAPISLNGTISSITRRDKLAEVELLAAMSAIAEDLPRYK